MGTVPVQDMDAKMRSIQCPAFFCVLGMSIDYRVKVPNSPAGGKS